MTRKQARRIGLVMVAYANGAEVECKEVAIIGKDVWHSPPDPDNPSFAPSAEWRMKEIFKQKHQNMNKEYFVVTNSFAAPFFSDTGTDFVSGNSPEEALIGLAKSYDHPCGLYAAALYQSSDDYHKGKPGLLRWLSNDARVLQEEKEKRGGCCSIMGMGPGKVQINGDIVTIEDPKSGRIVPWD